MKQNNITDPLLLLLNKIKEKEIPYHPEQKQGARLTFGYYIQPGEVDYEKVLASRGTNMCYNPPHFEIDDVITSTTGLEPDLIVGIPALSMAATSGQLQVPVITNPTDQQRYILKILALEVGVNIAIREPSWLLFSEQLRRL